MLDQLKSLDALRDDDEVAHGVLPAVPPSFGDGLVFDRLTHPLAEALRRSGRQALYRHQEAAMLAALDGHNVVLQAPTASGKSLSFQVPLLDAVVRDRSSHVLMIYPNKALALDQREQLERLSKLASGRAIESWWYDGDTPQEQRKLIRQRPPPILITNPDMLHNSFLGHHEQWRTFYQTLKWVIIDEIHEYRGYFGSNVSMILRRLSHHLSSLGVCPQFFLCSATCANAKQHAENLTGLPFAEINAENSIRPRREFYFINPAIPDYRYLEILQRRAVNASLACMIAGKSVLTFCPTRNLTERCHRMAMQEIQRLAEEGVVDLDPGRIKVFRGGLNTDERHEIQEGLRNGSVQVAFTTNALELGIDIGGLDGVILAGFPDSMMSAWQRVGRAGRKWNKDAFVIYYARNNPLDQFYAENLDAFLSKPLDDLVINHENEELIQRHVPCVLFETEADGDQTILGTAFAKAVKVREGAKPPPKGFWPHGQVDIRGGGKGMFTLEHGSEVIGTMSAHQKFREAYENAIYMHGGSTYRVEEVTHTGRNGVIRLEKEDPNRRTNPMIFTNISSQELYEARQWVLGEGEVDAVYEKVSIVENLTLVKEVHEHTGEVYNQWEPSFNSATFDSAHACSIRFILEEGPEGVTALQHIFRVGVTFSIPVDTHDMFPHAKGNEKQVFIVESYPGGIGVARKVFEKWQNILWTGVKLAEACKCVRGCPSCIVPPRSRHDLDKLDKRAGIELARRLLDVAERGQEYEFRNGFWEKHE